MLSGLMLSGAGLIAAATVAGAWLARRRSGHPTIWFAITAGILLVIAGLHLLPDAWADARAGQIWLLPPAAVGGFIAAGLAARAGCGCRAHAQQASGVAVAAALAFHRFLEGWAVVLTDSAAVTVALAAHAFGEGVAIATLLGPRSPRMAAWLAAMCVSPLIGAAAAGTLPDSATVAPVLIAVAAGVIAQAAWVSLRAAFSGLAASRMLLSRPAGATATAAVITALAVHLAG